MSIVSFIYDKANISTENYCLFETQGVIQNDGNNVQNQSIGRFDLMHDGSAYLLIGTNRLAGKIVPLKKAIAVSQKVLSHDKDKSSTSPNNEYVDVDYNIKAIIKYKFLFKKRPDLIL
ncbi:hypothetical protein AYI70_g11736 [Smittium culicis]|uniref:Uncharacterized protein n=1 Tax=Smittium culicis TaxID=133412 RepID=A0A1R1X0H7_9FUNG|nr:hypothetical protein AYI70_g11736 [Smittium culicis]